MLIPLHLILELLDLAVRLVDLVFKDISLLPKRLELLFQRSDELGKARVLVLADHGEVLLSVELFFARISHLKRILQLLAHRLEVRLQVLDFDLEILTLSAFLVVIAAKLLEFGGELKNYIYNFRFPIQNSYLLVFRICDRDFQPIIPSNIFSDSCR